jgi:uncharacterized protein (DUF1697 family)
MRRYVAFLRAINVGNHQVKMDELRRYFEPLGFGNVSTFIASGNVIFESDESADQLEQRIEQHLEACLGYEVGTFVRSEEDIKAIAEHDPFDEAGTDYVVLLRQKPDRQTRERLERLTTDDDLVSVHGREVYWKPRVFHFSSVGGELQKILRKEHTIRNANTLRRLAAKFESSDDQAPRRSRKASGSVSTRKP